LSELFYVVLEHTQVKIKAKIKSYRTPRQSQDITRNSAGDEIANVNFLYDHIVHAQENTTDSCINSATDRFLQRRFTKFSEIAQ